MTVRRLIIAALFVFLGVVILSGWMAYRRVRQYVAGFSEPLVKADLTESKPAPSAANRLTPSRLPMEAAFESGKLPEPLPIPAGDPDNAAEELAKKVAAKNEQSTAALLTALQMAGFSIRDPKGELYLKPAGATQGMGLDAFSIASMSKLYNHGWHISLADLGTILSTAIPRFRSISLPEALAGGIAASTRGEQPLRFWSRFIVELGKQSSPANDLSSAKVDASVQLDAIQTSLILRRLYGDLMSHATSAQSKLPHTTRHSNTNSEGLSPRPAVYHPSARDHFLLTAGDGGDGGSPCDLGEGVKDLLDANGIYRTTEWEALIEEVEKEVEEEAGAKIASSANGVLAILRFILMYAALDAEITMDSDVLVRTYDTSPGETRLLTAKVWFDLGNWQILNCLRPFLNLAGMDFGNLPNHGAAEGVGVQWVLVSGGAPLPGQFHNDPQGLLDATHSALVFFDNGGGAEGSTWNKVTDKEGKNSIKVTGNPQPIDLSNRKRQEVMKEMVIAVNIQMKRATAENFVGEILDVLGPALGIASGDLPAGLAAALTETLYRMHLDIGDVFTFPVKDWAADGLWTGTITITGDYIDNPPPHSSVRKASDGEEMGKTTWTHHEERHASAQLTLTNSLTPGGSQVVTGTGSGKRIYRNTEDSVDTCSDRNYHRPDHVYHEEDQGSEELVDTTFPGAADIVLDNSSTNPLKYHISGGMGGVNLRTKFQQSGSSKWSGCGGPSTEKNWGGPPTIGALNALTAGATATADPRHPGVLKGSTTVDSGGYWGKLTISWDLTMN